MTVLLIGTPIDPATVKSMTITNLLATTDMIEPAQTGEISYTLPITIAAIIGVAFIAVGLIVGDTLLGSFIGIIGHMSTSSKHYDRINMELEKRYSTPVEMSNFTHYNISQAVTNKETIILPAMMSDTDPSNMTYSQDTGEYIINKEGAKLRENLVYRITPTTIELMWQDGDTLKPFTETQKQILQSSKSQD